MSQPVSQKKISHAISKLASQSKNMSIGQWVIMTHFPCRCYRHCCQHICIWCRDKIIAILQNTYINSFSWIKTWVFPFRVHRNLLLRVQLTNYYWYRQWLVAWLAPSRHLRLLIVWQNFTFWNVCSDRFTMALGGGNTTIHTNCNGHDMYSKL